MTKKMIFAIVSSVCVSFCSGVVIGRITKKTKVKKENTFGTLRIDFSEQDEPPMIFLELKCSQDELFSANEIKLNVVKKNYI